MGRAKTQGLYCTLKELQSLIKPHPTRLFTPSVKKWKNRVSISTTTRNVFLELAETKAQSLKSTSCYVYRGTNLGDQWPWKARELDPNEPYNETRYPQPATGVWLLKTSIIRKNCLAQQGGQFTTSIGSLTCLGQRFYTVTTQKSQWWGSTNHTVPNPHPLSNFYHL
jgi:hypothetical protein